MDIFQTEQEKFWAGNFGDEYNKRNADKELIAGNLYLFSELFKKMVGIKSLIEFGANIGLNLVAIKKLKFPLSGLTASWTQGHLFKRKAKFRRESGRYI
jgi:hypothetical protein